MQQQKSPKCKRPHSHSNTGDAIILLLLLLLDKKPHAAGPICVVHRQAAPNNSGPRHRPWQACKSVMSPQKPAPACSTLQAPGTHLIARAHSFKTFLHPVCLKPPGSPNTCLQLDLGVCGAACRPPRRRASTVTAVRQCPGAPCTVCCAVVLCCAQPVSVLGSTVLLVPMMGPPRSRKSLRLGYTLPSSETSTG